MTDDKRDFFVSFNQADRSWATWIAWVLEEKGYSVVGREDGDGPARPSVRLVHLKDEVALEVPVLEEDRPG